MIGVHFGDMCAERAWEFSAYTSFSELIGMYNMERFCFLCERGDSTSDYGKVHCETNKIERFLIKETANRWVWLASDGRPFI
jgi:hypothetical protein